MDGRYFRNIERVKKIAAELKLEIVPALFSIGYSNDLLWHDPNLIEAMPVRDALFVVQHGQARVELEGATRLKGGDFSDLTQWDWKDAGVQPDHGTALIRDPHGKQARIVQKIILQPFRQYHLSVRVKTQDFRGKPEAKFIAGKRTLNSNHLGVKATQDWPTHRVVFNRECLSPRGDSHSGLDHAPRRFQFSRIHRGQSLPRLLGWPDRLALVCRRPPRRIRPGQPP